jgi:hypothetical protein
MRIESLKNFIYWEACGDALELVDSCWAFLQSNLNFVAWRIIIVPLLLTMKILSTSFLESTGVLSDMTVVNAWPTSESDTSESQSESFRSLFYQSLKKITFELFRFWCNLQSSLLNFIFSWLWQKLIYPFKSHVC